MKIIKTQKFLGCQKSKRFLSKYLLIGFLISIVFLVGCTNQPAKQEVTNFEQCVAAGNPVMESFPRQCRAEDNTFVEQTIGGQRDEHGCLGPAGYGWNQTINACVREWELNDSQKEAARITVAPLSYPVTVTGVDAASCFGCFTVHLQRNDNQAVVSVTLIDWKISTQSENKHYCTAEEKAAEICTMEYAPVCGDNEKTYGNDCSACGSKEIEYYVNGECKL